MSGNGVVDGCDEHTGGRDTVSGGLKVENIDVPEDYICNRWVG